MFAALEPALLVGAFSMLFMLWVGASRLDLTIVKGPEWEARQVCSLLCCCCVAAQYPVVGSVKIFVAAS